MSSTTSLEVQGAQLIMRGPCEDTPSPPVQEEESGACSDTLKQLDSLFAALRRPLFHRLVSRARRSVRPSQWVGGPLSVEVQMSTPRCSGILYSPGKAPLGRVTLSPDPQVVL